MLLYVCTLTLTVLCMYIFCLLTMVSFIKAIKQENSSVQGDLSNSPNVSRGYKPAITFCMLVLTKSLSLQETTAKTNLQLATHTLKMASYTDTELVQT